VLIVHIQHSNGILVNECISVIGRNSFFVNMQTEIENTRTHSQIHQKQMLIYINVNTTHC